MPKRRLDIQTHLLHLLTSASESLDEPWDVLIVARWPDSLELFSVSNCSLVESAHLADLASRELHSQLGIEWDTSLPRRVPLKRLRMGTKRPKTLFHKDSSSPSSGKVESEPTPGRATLIVWPSGKTIIHEWAEDEQPSLTWLQSCVGGNITLAMGRDGKCFGYLNDKGMCSRLPVNDAVLKWLPPNGTYAYHGVAVLLFGFDLSEETEQKTPDIADLF